MILCTSDFNTISGSYEFLYWKAISGHLCTLSIISLWEDSIYNNNTTITYFFVQKCIQNIMVWNKIVL